MRDPLFSISSPRLVIFCLLIIVILTGVKQYLVVVLICIFLMISDVEHLFMYLLAVCVCVFRDFANFLIGLFGFLAELYEFFIQWYLITCH